MLTSPVAVVIPVYSSGKRKITLPSIRQHPLRLQSHDSASETRSQACHKTKQNQPSKQKQKQFLPEEGHELKKKKKASYERPQVLHNRIQVDANLQHPLFVVGTLLYSSLDNYSGLGNMKAHWPHLHARISRCSSGTSAIQEHTNFQKGARQRPRLLVFPLFEQNAIPFQLRVLDLTLDTV